MLFHAFAMSLQVVNHRLRIIITTKPTLVLCGECCVEQFTGAFEDCESSPGTRYVGNLLFGNHKKTYDLGGSMRCRVGGATSGCNSCLGSPRGGSIIFPVQQGDILKEDYSS